MQVVQAGSLVEELRSHMPCGKKKQNIKEKHYCNKLHLTLKMVHIKKNIFKKNKIRSLDLIL